MRNLSQPKLAEAPILLAPFPEQRRIVQRIEALLADVNKAKEGLRRVPLILNRFRQAVLAAGCSGKLTEEWRSGKLADMSAASEIRDLPPLLQKRQVVE